MKKTVGFILFLTFVVSLGVFAAPRSVRVREAEQKKQFLENQRKQKDDELRQAKQQIADLERRLAAANSAQERTTIQNQLSSVSLTCVRLEGDILDINYEIGACEVVIARGD